MSFAEAWRQAHPEASVPFEEGVFWDALYSHARVPARILWRLWPSYFERDLDLVRRTGAATSLNELKFEIDNFRYQHPEFGLLRRALKVRVSGQRIMKLARPLMPKE